jgi:hypothetical protein
MLVKKAQHIAEIDPRSAIEWFPTGPWFADDPNSPKVHGYCEPCMKMVEITSINRDCIW